jgi:hypothetical protein
VTASVSGPTSLRVGETGQLAITLNFSDGTNNFVQPSQASSVVIASSDVTVLTVSSAGEVRGVSVGNATVTVTPSVSTVGAPGNRTAGTIQIAVVQ